MRISRQHHLGHEEARQRVESAAKELAGKYNLSYKWQGDDLRFHGTGVKGHIAVAETTIDIDVKLGFALMMLESTIRSSVEEAIDHNLA
ncbi:MAG: polyhydroxyalkanoic acid system family protein [Gammaproteobacteria bacterium]|nr:polyhydroxyalkanoic acid system family protein [Gammaproteobacteria bacterium]